MNKTGTNRSDSIVGTSSADKIWSNLGNDTISGGAGDDLVVGGFGADTMLGDLGNDVLLRAPTRASRFRRRVGRASMTCSSRSPSTRSRSRTTTC